MTDFPFRLPAWFVSLRRGSAGPISSTQATQDIRRRIANCFVAVEAATGSLAAYYTIAAASIPLIDLPPEEAKRLPRYPTLPAVRIGRLAVDQNFQGRGLGGALLMDAARRSIHSPPAVYALLVDAKNTKRWRSMRNSVSEPLPVSRGRCSCRWLRRRGHCWAKQQFQIGSERPPCRRSIWKQPLPAT
jgi:GNAT superfamily N-acetyltransferase